MTYFFRNKNLSGKVFNMVFGLAEILDGLVRILSLGFLATSLPVTCSGLGVKSHLKKLKKIQEQRKLG